MTLRRWCLLLTAGVLMAGVETAPTAAVRTQNVLKESAQDGRLTIRIGTPRPGGSYAVSSIELEAYIARVLAGEALPGSPPAALEALAIAIRTYTIVNLNAHRKDGFDLCDSTHCQVMRTATPDTERAARATAGQILLFGGAPATVYYSASCGGQTEVPSAVWPAAEDVPYLPSHEDADGCGGRPEWRAQVALADLQRAFREAGYRGTLRDMRVVSRDSSGRVARLQVEGLSPSELSGQDLRVVLGGTIGWQFIRSALFDMRRDGNSFRFDGRGYGHGVGMCVIGSARLAENGETAASILARYFPGTVIAPFAGVVPPGSISPESSAGVASPASRPVAGEPVAGVRVILPDQDAIDRETVARTTAAARDELVQVLGVSAPATLTVRAYRTNAEFERGTGRPWFTLGAISGGGIHLAPTRLLRQQGRLEQTIRREVARLLVDAALKERRAWVRVGAALYFGATGGADRAASPNGPNGLNVRTRCPSDADLLRPTSAGALSNAYRDALDCFAKQISDGRAWRDVR